MNRNTTTGDFGFLFAKAESAASGGDWAFAAETYESLVRSRPEEFELKLKLASAYDELGRFDEAIELLTDPSVYGRGKAKQKLAKIYISAKDYHAARPLVDELVAASPGNLKFQKWKAICQENRAADPRLEHGLKKAQALASEGQLQEAEQLYLQLVAQHPEVSRVHLQLARLYAHQKRWADSIAPLRAGLAVDPGNTKIRMALARALFKEGQFAEVLMLLNRMDHGKLDVDAMFLLQRCHMKLRNWSQAEKLGARLLLMAPSHDPIRRWAMELRENALVERAAAGIEWLSQLGRLDRAAGYREIADRFPESSLAWFRLGAALADRGQHEDSVLPLTNALRLRPMDRRVRERLTRSVLNTSDEERILTYVQEAIAAGTADFECHRWLAQYHHKKHDWQAALASARKAIEIKSDSASARMWAARALMRLCRLKEALDELEVMLTIGTRPVVALQLKADVYVRLARLDDAIDLYHQALEHDPDNSLINARLSYAFLLKGDVAGFHSLHEKRRQIKTFIESNKRYPFSEWNGELDLEGKLLVWSESGLGVGQNILHMTFLNSLAALGLDVVLEVEPRLADICRRSFQDLLVVPNHTKLPQGISHHTPIGSLSRWFKPDLASFETLRPYFLPDGQEVEGHRKRLQQAAGKGQVLIGISWTSTNPFVGDEKSVPLDQLLETISLPGVTAVNLQYGDHSQAIAEAEARTGKRLMDSGIDNSEDLDGLASVVAAMDLVVCIGHTTAHLAGAIGTPNFVLLPAGPFAHWLAQGERCVWYPGSKLFRRAPIDPDWRPVLDQVAGAVGEFVNNHDGHAWLATTLLSVEQKPLVGAGAMSNREIRDAVQAFAAQGAYRQALKLISRLSASHLTRAMQLQRADMLALIGCWEEARKIYVALRQANGVDLVLERQILSLSLAIYDLENALPIARLLAQDEPAGRVLVARILYRLGRHEDAIQELREESLQGAIAPELYTLLGNILLEMHAFERAEDILAVASAMNRRTEDYVLLGRSLSAQGRRQEALSVLEKGLTLSRKKDPAGHFWRTYERVEGGLVALTPLPPLLGNIPAVTPGDAAIFFSADNTYFWQHGLVLLGSIARNWPSAKCHLHVVNPDAGVAQAIEVVRRLAPDLKLSYSYEQVDLERCSNTHIRTYYASVRFVRLAEIFAQAPATYLCVDADSIVRRDIEAEGCLSEIKDVGVRMRFDELPHMSLVASASMLRPTHKAAEFIDRVSSLIKPTLEAREAVWFLDQVVLSHVVRELGHKVGISQLDMTFLDWFFHDDSLIWTGKGRRKSDDDRYKREVSRCQYLQKAAEIAALMPEEVRASLRPTDRAVSPVSSLGT